jgi:hypothetical protein
MVFWSVFIHLRIQGELEKGPVRLALVSGLDPHAARPSQSARDFLQQRLLGGKKRSHEMVPKVAVGFRGNLGKSSSALGAGPAAGGAKKNGGGGNKPISNINQALKARKIGPAAKFV